MQETPIGWTDFSTNLLRYRDAEGNVVHACVRISDGCRFCYACALAGRWGRKGKDFTAENMKSLTPFFDEQEAAKVLKSRKIRGQKVFIDDMTDLFGDWVPDEIIDQHFAIFALRPDVTFQVLTKRAQRMREYFSADWHRRVAALLMENRAQISNDYEQQVAQGRAFGSLTCGPHESRFLANVHLGVSVEDQKTVDIRLPFLLEIPAAVRWVSVEPLLGDVEFGDPPPNLDRPSYFYGYKNFRPTDKHDIDGIVIGGESGSGHRQMPLESALKLARYAHKAGVSVYFKQDSGPRPGMQGRVPDDVWAMKEWPEAKAVTV